MNVITKPVLPSLLYSWKEKKIDYENKKANRKWGETFQKKASSRSSRERGMFLYEDKRRLRIEESGWKNILVTLPDIQEKTVVDTVSLEDGNGDSSLRDRGNYCLTCWEIVYSGNNRTNCSQCSAIIHTKCIDTEEGQNGEKWQCPDCIDDLTFKMSPHEKNRQHQESKLIFAVVKIQSFCRMIRYRLDYIFAKIGFTRLQLLFHSKKAWMELKTYVQIMVYIFLAVK
jgi:DNA-directed RNA polymerase subunit RPC12/RpoP